MRADPKTIDILAMLSVLPDGFPYDERAMEELESHLPEGYDHRKALLTMRRVSLVHVDEAGAPRRLRMLSPIRAFCEQRLEAPEELRNSITSFYVEKMGHFMDVTDPDGHAIIPGELDNVYTVLMQGWKEGRGSPMVAIASILFTEWSVYVGNPVEEVIGLAIEGVVGQPGLHGTCQRQSLKNNMAKGNSLPNHQRPHDDQRTPSSPRWDRRKDRCKKYTNEKRQSRRHRRDTRPSTLYNTNVEKASALVNEMKATKETHRLYPSHSPQTQSQGSSPTTLPY
jgi:hypothetical protein